MATYYARNVTGNWGSSTSWDSTSSSGAGPAGPPTSGDTAIFDSGFTGNITVATSTNCAVITAEAGATGTLTYGSGYALTTTGNVTFVSGFHLAGTGKHRLNTGTPTITTGGLSLPALVIVGSGVTATLADAISVTGEFTLNYSLTLAGAYDISCDSFNIQASSDITLSIVAGQTITVATSMAMGAATSTFTIKSGTTSSTAYLHYNGTSANSKIFRMTFTDITCTHGIDNWYGGTLTRTSGITNRTSSDIGSGGGGLPILDGSVVR